MTALALSRWAGSLTGRGSPPAGDTGRRAVKHTDDVVDELKAGLAARTSWVFNDLHQLAQESGIDIGKSRTFSLAKRFLLALPGSVPSPELSLDADGEVSFDWLGTDGRMLTVVLREDGRLAYASRLSSFKRDHGKEQFDDELPKSIIQMVQQVTGG